MVHSGNADRSGKLGILGKLLRHWQEGGHKALVFTQTQQMLDIVEKMVAGQGYSYHRSEYSLCLLVATSATRTLLFLHTCSPF